MIHCPQLHGLPVQPIFQDISGRWINIVPLLSSQGTGLLFSAPTLSLVTRAIDSSGHSCPSDQRDPPKNIVPSLWRVTAEKYGVVSTGITIMYLSIQSLPLEKKKRVMAVLSAEAILNVRLLLVAFSISVGSIRCGVEARGSREASGQREFDYFNLALQWPGTFCQRTRHCCSSNACCRGSNTPAEFTIHGLWPDYNDGTWPACCTDSRFNPKEISSLHDALDKYWPSLSCDSISSCNGGEGSFWGHEWEKHGTCSSPVVQDEYNYFLTTLNVYFKYNVTKVLNEAGYVPSNTEKYPLGGIVSAIENAFHITPKLVCSKGDVEELHLCFDKDLKPGECAPESSNQQSSCPSYVSLPAYVSPGLENVEDVVSGVVGMESI